MTSTQTQPAVKVLVAGATGLVGQQALRQLLADPLVVEVRALVRRAMSPADLLGSDGDKLAGVGKLRICHADFDRLEEHSAWFQVDWVLCALGTTIKKAGSRAAFRQVDFDYPLQLAQLAHAQGASRFMLVSALGADARSRVFYSRVKGELEEAIRAIGFAQTVVARPSLLAGKRAEFRLGERLALTFGCLMPRAYKPVRVEQVAAGLIAAAHEGRSGWQVLNNMHLRTML